MRRNYRGVDETLTLRDYLRNTWRALPALVLPVLILGGIASGAFTPTEASVVAVFYALFAGRVIYRTLTWRDAAGDPRALGADDGVGADHRRDVGGVRVGADGVARAAGADRADRRHGTSRRSHSCSP